MPYVETKLDLLDPTAGVFFQLKERISLKPELTMAVYTGPIVAADAMVVYTGPIVAADEGNNHAAVKGNKVVFDEGNKPARKKTKTFVVEKAQAKILDTIVESRKSVATWKKPKIEKVYKSRRPVDDVLATMSKNYSVSTTIRDMFTILT